MHQALTVSVLSVALSAAAVAQTNEQFVPRLAAGFEGNDIAQYPFGRTGFRTQMLIETRAVAQASVFVFAVEFRPDTSNSIGSPAVTLPNVTIAMSVTGATPATMAADFATNRGLNPIVVYQGPVSLPAHTSVPGQAAPWFQVQLQQPFGYLANQGNLLIEISASDPAPASTNYVLDSWLPGGTVLGYGTSGQLSQADGVRLTISGNGTMGRFSGLIPGGQFSILAQSQFNPWSGELLLGLRKAAQPLDLTPIGAPGNALYIDPISNFPFTLSAPPIGFGYRSTWTLVIPTDPAIAGQSLHMQPLVIDQPANSLGLVLGSAVEVVVGDPLPYPMRQLNARDDTLTTGTFQYTSGIYGGAVVKLVGNFQ